MNRKSFLKYCATGIVATFIPCHLPRPNMNDSMDVLRVPEAGVTPITQPRRSFWCWLRRHRMFVAGYNYRLEEGNIDPIKVCQCKLNNTAIPTFVDQLRNQQ